MRHFERQFPVDGDVAHNRSMDRWIGESVAYLGECHWAKPPGSGIRSPEGRRWSLPAQYHRVTRYISTSLQHLTTSPVASDNITGRAARVSSYGRK